MNLYLRAAIIAILAAITFAGNAKADTQQDHTYYSLLENNGVHINSPATAKAIGLHTCRQLYSGRPWQLVLTDLMTEGDDDIATSTVILGSAIAAYCPTMAPSSGGTVA